MSLGYRLYRKRKWLVIPFYKRDGYQECLHDGYRFWTKRGAAKACRRMNATSAYFGIDWKVKRA